jgi:hypothetical protein
MRATFSSGVRSLAMVTIHTEGPIKKSSGRVEAPVAGSAQEMVGWGLIDRGESWQIYRTALESEGTPV